jgi:hypothetical protein
VASDRFDDRQTLSYIPAARETIRRIDIMRVCCLVLTGLTAWIFAASAGTASEDSAHLHVMVIDEDEQDWIVLRNTSDCAAITGHARIDFSASRGSVVIDTDYGGPGTRDPGLVRVLSGPAVVGDVEDGARAIDIAVHALPPQGQAIVTLDIDNERGWFENARVMATPGDIRGSVAEFTATGPDGATSRAGFADGRLAILPVPATCDDGASDPSATPMS